MVQNRKPSPEELRAALIAQGADPKIFDVTANTVREKVLSMLPMSSQDFFRWRRAVSDRLDGADHGLLHGFSRGGMHVYGLDGQPVDYVPDDHTVYDLHQPITPPNKGLGSAVKTLYRCPGCGSTHIVDKITSRSDILLVCPRGRYPIVFRAHWLQTLVNAVELAETLNAVELGE